MIIHLHINHHHHDHHHHHHHHSHHHDHHHHDHHPHISLQHHYQLMLLHTNIAVLGSFVLFLRGASMSYSLCTYCAYWMILSASSSNIVSATRHISTGRDEVGSSICLPWWIQKPADVCMWRKRGLSIKTSITIIITINHHHYHHHYQSSLSIITINHHHHHLTWLLPSIRVTTVAASPHHRAVEVHVMSLMGWALVALIADHTCLVLTYIYSIIHTCMYIYVHI